MSNWDFNDEDLNEVIEEADTSDEASAQEKLESVQFEEQMSEVEARLEMAQYYRLVLNQSLFDEIGNQEVASRVEEEIRGFIRERMQVLVGVSQEPKMTKIFTDSEIQAIRTLVQPEVAGALKALAAKVLKKPAILEAKPLTSSQHEPKTLKVPTLKRVSTASRQAPQTAPKKEVAPQAKVAKVGKRQEKVYKTVINDEGKEIKMNVTPVAKPVGAIQPFPTPTSKAAIEAASASSAYTQAAVAMAGLEQKLRGK